MENKINHVVLLLLFSFLSNIYSQTERFDKLQENNSNKSQHNMHKAIIDDFQHYGRSANYKIKKMHKHDYDSISVVDSSLVTKANGDKEKYIYTYDSNGNITSELKEEWDGNQWANYGQYTSTYNSNGNMTSKLKEDWDGSQWIMSDGYYSFYDSFGSYCSFHGSEINVSYCTITDIFESKEEINEFSLSQNYPNPFNPSTKIKYRMLSKVKRQTSNVSLIVYDVLGRRITTLVNKQQKAGYYEVQFTSDNGQLTSGVYFYQLRAGDFIETKKMILLR